MKSLIYVIVSLFGRNCFLMGLGSNFGATEIVNEYDQEIPQSQTADNPVAL